MKSRTRQCVWVALAGIGFAALSACFTTVSVDVDWSASTMSVAPAVLVADGNARATVTVQVRQKSGMPIPGVDVRIYAPNVAVAQGGPTDENGVTVATVTSQTVGTITLYADAHLQGSTQTLPCHATVQFKADGQGTLETHPPAAIALSIPASFEAGVAQAITVTVFDQNGNVDTDYVGVITLGYADARATPTSVNFTTANEGVASVDATLYQSGTQDVQASDPVHGLHDTAQTLVLPGPAASLSMTGVPSVAQAGDRSTITVAVFDAFGNEATQSGDTVAITSTDGQFGATPTQSFTPGGSAVVTFVNAVQWRSKGTQVLTAADATSAHVQSAHASTVVQEGPAARLAITGPSTVGAGDPAAFQVIAYDAYGNTATAFNGAVSFSSSDARAFVPSAYTFAPASDAGVHAFGAVFITAPTQSITAQSAAPALTVNANLTVTPGVATNCNASVSNANVVALAQPTLYVRVKDVYGNPTRNYAGTLRVTSTDANGSVPPNQQLAPDANGVIAYTTGVSLRTAGLQKLTARDVANAQLACAANVLVNPNVATHFDVTTDNAYGIKSSSNAVTLVARDAWQNVATGYSGVASFSSAPATATATPSLAVFANGRTSAQRVSFPAVGAQSLTATDTVDASVFGTTTINIVPGTVADIAVAGGGGTSACALFTGGPLKCWGVNGSGQLGLGDTITRGAAAGQMGSALPLVDLGRGRTARHVYTAALTTCAVLDTNDVKCWGANFYGALGTGDVISRGATPNSMGDALPKVDVGTGRSVVSAGVGGTSACALLDNGGVKCWGLSLFGNLGSGAAGSLGTTASTIGDNLPYVGLGTGVSAKSICGGYAHYCVVTNQNNVKCWGWNVTGQLGLGDTNDRGMNAGDMNDNLPNVLLGGQAVASIACGESFTCATFQNGNATCWGNNLYGNLGLGDQATRNGATALPPIAWTESRGVAFSATDNHTCGLLADGNATCWGANPNGELGLGSTVSPVLKPPVGINLGTGRTVTKIHATSTSSCALLDDGTVKCFGAGSSVGYGDTLVRGTAAAQMGDNLPTVPLY